MLVRVAAILAALLSLSAHADGWPSKPVKMVVPFPAGGPTDVMTRVVAEKLSSALGRSVVVDNKPGAGGTIGADYNGNPKATPPCGVTYQRSTQNRGPFQLNVSTVWAVRWQGSDGAGGGFAPATVTDPTPITVREIQTVNR
jgi:tripartite-type tricarboxylate transporter receptor subunit TctC